MQTQRSSADLLRAKGELCCLLSPPEAGKRRPQHGCKAWARWCHVKQSQDVQQSSLRSMWRSPARQSSSAPLAPSSASPASRNRCSEVQNLLLPPWEVIEYETADPWPTAHEKCWSSESCCYCFSALTPASTLTEEVKDALENVCSGAKWDCPQQSRNRALPIAQGARGACEMCTYK